MYSFPYLEPVCVQIYILCCLNFAHWNLNFTWFFEFYVCYAMLCYAKSLQLCLTLCDPRDGSPAGSPVPGILQARTLEWVAISFSNAWKWKGKVKSLSHVWLLATPWTAAYQAPPSLGFSRQEYWSGVSLPSLFHVLDKIIFAYFLPDILYFDISVLFYVPISYCITKEIFAIIRESKKLSPTRKIPQVQNRLECRRRSG